jgi:hypothetical protein
MWPGVHAAAGAETVAHHARADHAAIDAVGDRGSGRFARRITSRATSEHCRESSVIIGDSSESYWILYIPHLISSASYWCPDVC